MVTTLTQLLDAEFPLWDAIMSMVSVSHAEPHSSIKHKPPHASLMDVNNISSEDVKLVLNPTSSDTTHAS